MSNGLVGIIANDFARVSIFTACAFKLEVPDGWKKEMLIGGDWCGARNTLCQMALDGGNSHLWFMDDDHAFPPQMLNKLLAHDKPLVTPICLTRTHPFKPVQYTERNVENDLQYLPIPLSQSATDGLVEIQAGGCAGMLIRRDVLEAIPPPWFEYTERSEDITFCLPPGAWIGGGVQTRIEDVGVGDYVHSHAGRECRVRDTSRRTYSGELVKIKPAYGDPLRMTPNHRLQIHRDGGRVWVAAEQVVVGDRLCVPKVTGSTPLPIDWLLPDLVPGLTTTSGDMVGYSRTRHSAVKVRRAVSLTPALGRLLGYYIAEGTLGRDAQHVAFCFGAHEEEYVEDAISLLHEEFGLRAHVATQNGCTRVTATSAVVARFLRAVCGEGALHKRLPLSWDSFDRESLSEMMTGYWRGDGSFDPRNGFRMSTASPALAADIRAALLRLGIYAGVTFKANETAGAYIIAIPYPETRTFGAMVGVDTSTHIGKGRWSFLHQDDTHYYVRVQTVDRERYDGEVFNLSVEDDESYTVSGFAVHNCEKAKAAGFDLFADLSVRLGHVTTAVVWPAVDGERWTTGLDVGDLRLTVDTADNVVSDKTPQPATEKTWVWELRSVLSEWVWLRLLLPAGVPFNFKPLGETAQMGMVQWFCDEGLGEGFKAVGDAFVNDWEHDE